MHFAVVYNSFKMIYCIPFLDILPLRLNFRRVRRVLVLQKRVQDALSSTSSRKLVRRRTLMLMGESNFL